jgi:metal-responsive CopG/Arc/MetJ family transcriptional regulator
MRLKRTAANSKRRRITKASIARGGRKIIVDFPSDLYLATEKATSQLSINRSTLIRSAVREYLEKLHREELEKQLAEGYIANAAQARETAQAFEQVDSELL